MFRLVLFVAVLVVFNAHVVAACTVSNRKDLKDLLSPEVVAVVGAYDPQVVMRLSPWNNNRELAVLRIANSEILSGSAPRQFDLLLPHPTSFNDLKERFPFGTGFVVALALPRGDAKTDPAEPSIFRVAGGGPYGGDIFFAADTLQASAVRLIFDGEGDANAEVTLFNELFNYGQESRLR